MVEEIEMLHAIRRFKLTGWQGEKRKAAFAFIAVPAKSGTRR